VGRAYEIDGSDGRHMQIINAENNTYIYVKLYNDSKILTYTHSPILSADNSFGTDQDEDLFSVAMLCDPITKRSALKILHINYPKLFTDCKE
jgi:hypothetical protein